MVENLIIVRDILLKCFIISMLLLVFSTLMYVFFNDHIANVCQSLYNIDQQTETVIMIYSISAIKIINIMFFLIPAIAIHWNIKKLQK